MFSFEFQSYQFTEQAPPRRVLSEGPGDLGTYPDRVSPTRHLRERTGARTQSLVLPSLQKPGADCPGVGSEDVGGLENRKRTGRRPGVVLDTGTRYRNRRSGPDPSNPSDAVQ